MGKKNKKQKDDLEIKDNKKDPNNEGKVEDKDKVSIKKTFRDTGIIMGVIVAFVGILVFANRDAFNAEAQQAADNNKKDNEVVEADSEIAYKNLCTLANKQLISVKNLNKDLEYVSGLLSLVYSNSKVTYCALGNKQPGSSYLVKVTMQYIFNDDDTFVFKMTNLDMMSAVITYSVTTEVMNIFNDENINNKFDDKINTTLPLYDMDKVYRHIPYRADGSEQTFFSVTYAGTDLKIHSINEMAYNTLSDEFTIADEYTADPTLDEKMYALLGMILELE